MNNEKLYSMIESIIIRWVISGDKTAGNLTREIMKILSSKNTKELDDAIEVLNNHNKWRRGDDNSTPTDPTKLGISIDIILNYLK